MSNQGEPPHSPSVSTYTVTISPSAWRGLGRVPEKVREAALAFISGPLQQNPHRVGGPLGAERAGQFSARRADYRILYTIDGEHVTVVDVGHRGRVYR